MNKIGKYTQYGTNKTNINITREVMKRAIMAKQIQTGAGICLQDYSKERP